MPYPIKGEQRNTGKTHFKKGFTPWNKGRTEHRIDVIEKLSNSHKGKLTGSSNPNWRGGTTPLNLKIWQSPNYKQWRKSVLERDNYICQQCGYKHGKILAVHHIKRFAIILDEYDIDTCEKADICDELWNIDNGITLCKKCHEIIHSK